MGPLAMSGSTVTSLTLNALMLNRVRLSDETKSINSSLRAEYA